MKRVFFLIFFSAISLATAQIKVVENNTDCGISKIFMIKFAKKEWTL